MCGWGESEGLGTINNMSSGAHSPRSFHIFICISSHALETCSNTSYDVVVPRIPRLA
jgi:hypothetical protein